MKLTVLGARGSIPADGKDKTEFGGATSCILVQTDKSAVFIDAGTGIVNAPDIGNRSISLLITHPHADHLMGLPFFPYLEKKDARIDIYAKKRDGLSTHDQISRYLSKPLWPCTVDDYAATVVCHDIEGSFTAGDIFVDMMESNHPGQSLIYRLESGRKSVVYATDYEHGEEQDKALIEFCRGADMLLYDGQYTEKEYENRRGFGHSTAEHGMYIMEKSGVKDLRIVHHDPHHDDETLGKMESSACTPSAAFARQGEEIWLR